MYNYFKTLATSGIRLKLSFRQERKQERQAQRLGRFSLYLQPISAQKFELAWQQGRFTYAQTQKQLDGRYLYVRTLDGRMLAAKEDDIAHHSYLSNGKKVLSAGHFIFEQGRLCLFSNESGHYTPSNQEMAHEITFFDSIAENQDLIYEDHSNYPQTRTIAQYKTQAILAQGTIDKIKPFAVLNHRTSHFGKHLKRMETEPMTVTASANRTTPPPPGNYLDDQGFFVSASHSVSHYLDDQWLVKEDEPQEKTLLVTAFAPSRTLDNAHGFFTLETGTAQPVGWERQGPDRSENRSDASWAG